MRTATIGLVVVAILGLAICGSGAAPLPKRAPAGDASHAPVGTAKVKVNRGTSVVQDIGLSEPGTLQVGAIIQGRGAAIEILDEAGQPLPRQKDQSGRLESATMVQFEVSPKPGQSLKARFIAGPDADAEFTVTFTYSGRPTLAVRLDQYRYPAGSPITVYAGLVDAQAAPVTDFKGKVVAELHGPQPGTIALADDGRGPDQKARDGTFSGTFPAVKAPGSYGVVVSVDGSSSAYGRLVRKGTSSPAAVRGEGAKLSFLGAKPNDINGNGLAEELLLRFSAAVSVAGDYQLSAELHLNRRSIYPLHGFVKAPKAPASPEVVLRIPSNVIHESKGGPYTLSGIVLTDRVGDKSFHTIPDLDLGSLAPGSFEGLPAPSLTGCIPCYASERGGDEIVLRGANLDKATEVRFGGTKASFMVYADDSVGVIAPPGRGRVDITLVSPQGTSTLRGSFEYRSGQPD